MIDPNLYAAKVDECERLSRENHTLRADNEALRDQVRGLLAEIDSIYCASRLTGE